MLVYLKVNAWLKKTSITGINRFWNKDKWFFVNQNSIKERADVFGGPRGWPACPSTPCVLQGNVGHQLIWWEVGFNKVLNWFYTGTIYKTEPALHSNTLIINLFNVLTLSLVIGVLTLKKKKCVHIHIGMIHGAKFVKFLLPAIVSTFIHSFIHSPIHLINQPTKKHENKSHWAPSTLIQCLLL